MLETLRSGEPLTAKEKLIHDQGLVTVLRQIYDELDAAVLEARPHPLAAPELSESHESQRRSPVFAELRRDK